MNAMVALGPLPNLAAQHERAVHPSDPRFARELPANEVGQREPSLELVIDNDDDDVDPHESERTSIWEPPPEARDAERTKVWDPPSESKSPVFIAAPAAKDEGSWRPLADALEPRSESESTLIWEPKRRDDDAVAPLKPRVRRAEPPKPIVHEEAAIAPRWRGWIAVAVGSAVLLLVGAHTTGLHQTNVAQARGVTTEAPIDDDASPPTHEPHAPQRRASTPSDDLDDEIVIVQDGEPLDDEDAPTPAKRNRRRQTDQEPDDSETAAKAAALVGRATDDLARGRRDEAIILLEQAIDIQPTSAAAHATMSSAYFDRGDFDLAVAHGEEAVKLGFDVAKHHVLLGDAYFRTGHDAEATQQWTIAAGQGSKRAARRLVKIDEE